MKTPLKVVNENTNLEHFSSKSSLGDRLPSEVAIDSPLPGLQTKQASKKKNAINTLLRETPISSPDYTHEIENSIRKKTELEKWSKFFSGNSGTFFTFLFFYF